MVTAETDKTEYSEKDNLRRLLSKINTNKPTS